MISFLELIKYKITDVNSQFVIEVDELPTEVGINPFNKLKDIDS